MPVPAPVTRATLCDAAIGGPPTNQHVALSTLHPSGRNAVLSRTQRLTKEREDDATRAAAAWTGGAVSTAFRAAFRDLGPSPGPSASAVSRAADQAHHPVSTRWRERRCRPPLGRQDEGSS